MPFLAGLAVVFVGVAGGDARMDKQVQQVLAVEHVTRKSIATATVRTLAHHGDGAGDLVRELHVDGVIAAELIGSGHDFTLRFAIYGGDGGMKSLSEIPLDGPALTGAEIASLRETFHDDVHALVASAGSHHEVASEVADEDAPAPAPVAPPKAAPPARKSPAPVAKVAVAEPADASGTDDSPPGMDAPSATAAGGDSSDAVSADEIEAMTRGGGDAASVTASAEPASADDTLHVTASAGFGIAGRSFSPGPASVAAYSASAVGTVHLDARAQPTARTTIGVIAERALDMTTPMGTAVAATSMSRWEVVGGYTLNHGGAVEIAPQLGFGRRAFSIDSNDPGRSPDGDYQYLILGASASAALGRSASLQATFAFEPVTGGSDATEMAVGSTDQWAIAVGAAFEYRPMAHLVVRAAVDYQRFAWSWDMLGTRAAGSAVDSYPSGTLSLGAHY